MLMISISIFLFLASDPPPDAADGNGAEEGGGGGEANGNTPRSLLRTVVPLMSKGVPFLLLVLIKVLWEHSLGILVMLGLSLTFWHANKMLKNQVSLKVSRNSEVEDVFVLLSGTASNNEVMKSTRRDMIILIEVV